MSAITDEWGPAQNWYLVGAPRGVSGIFGPATHAQAIVANALMGRYSMQSGTVCSRGVLSAAQIADAEPIENIDRY